MPNISNKILSLIAFAVAASMAAAFAAPGDNEAERARKKADYLFLEGQNAYNTDRIDDFILLTRRAFELDSNNIDIAAEWSAIELARNGGDSATVARAYSRLWRQFEQQPDNYITGITMANIAARLGRTADVVRVWETLRDRYPAKAEPAEELANAYLRAYLRGDTAAYSKAISLFSTLEDSRGKSVELSSQKIRAFFLRSDTAGILSEVDTLVTRFGNDPYAMLFVGSTYDALSDSANTEKYFLRSCRLDSANGAAYMALGNFYTNHGNDAAYREHMGHALRSPDIDVADKLDIIYHFANKYIGVEADRPMLAALFADLEQMHPGEGDIHSLYAGYLDAIGQPRLAADQMEYAVALNGQSEEYWVGWVRYLAAADSSALIPRALEGARRFPKNYLFPIFAAQKYFASDSIDRAIAVLDSVDTSVVNNPDAVSSVMAFKGDLYAAAGDTAKALALYDDAILLNPDNSMAMNNAAYFMAERDIDLTRAETLSSKAVKLDPENPTYLDTYAWILFKKKDYSLAKQYIDMTLRLYAPQDTASCPAFQRGGLPDSTSSQLPDSDSSLLPEPPGFDILDHAGDIYFMNGDRDQAVEFWRRAEAIEPENELIRKKVQNSTIFFK